MRATWLTDIHLNFLRPHALAQFYARVKAEAPDALLVTGDIAEADSVVRFLGELVAESEAQVYFVLGNHDYYRSNLRVVRDEVQRASPRATWLPAHEAMAIGDGVVMIGVDGWGDARCGDLDSTVQLSDWKLIEDFKRAKDDRVARIDICKRLGGNEARALRDKLELASEAKHLLVLTHVPPFPEACVYGGEPSTPPWLPWFTCISTGEMLRGHAEAHPEQQILVLCGHSHGAGSFKPLPNLEVRTGGWPAGVADYGNPIVQQTIEV